MRRRALLATIGGGLTLAGCVDRTGVSADPTPARSISPGKSKDTLTADATTGAGVTATFQIFGGHSPTDDTVEATFSDQQVTVTGSMDPAGCNEPMLKSVGYDFGRIELVNRQYSPDLVGIPTTDVSEPEFRRFLRSKPLLFDSRTTRRSRRNQSRCVCPSPSFTEQSDEDRDVRDTASGPCLDGKIWVS